MPMQNLFVAKLPRNLTDGDLLAIFREYKPLSAKVMLDAASGKSKGFGFVLFNSEEEGQIAYNALNRKSTRSCGHNFTLVIYPSNHDGKAASESSNALYIRNIPMTISQECVEQFLRSFGTLTYCAMREDHYGSPVWVVYAEYNTIEEARHALCKLHGNHSYFHGSAPILAKFEDSEAAKRQRRQRREEAVNAESKVKSEENSTKKANVESTDSLQKVNHSSKLKKNVDGCKNVNDNKNDNNSSCNKIIEDNAIKHDIANNVNNEDGNNNKENPTFTTSNSAIVDNKLTGVEENTRIQIGDEVWKSVSAVTSSFYSSGIPKTADNTAKSNISQPAQTPSILLPNTAQRQVWKEGNVAHHLHSNHANPFHPSYRSSASAHVSLEGKSDSLFVDNNNKNTNKMNTNNSCKSSVDYTGHLVFDKVHIDKTFSVTGTSSIKSGFDANHDSLVAGLSSSMSCTSAQTGQILQPSQFPPPYHGDVGLAEKESQPIHIRLPLAQESDFMSKNMSRSLNISSFNELSQSYMSNHMHALNNTTSTIPQSLPQLTQPAHRMASCQASRDQISTVSNHDEGERNYCYTLNDNGEPILLGMTTSNSSILPTSQLTATRAQSCPYNFLEEKHSSSDFNVNEIGSSTPLGQVIPTTQSLSYLSPISVTNINNSNTINNSNISVNTVNNASSVNSVLCLPGQQIQLCQPKSAANTINNLSLLAPQPQSTLMLIDGTQQYVVSSDAVNISSLSSPTVSSPYSANSPMFLASISTPQPEQQQQQQLQQQLATELFDIYYGKSTPALPQVLNVGPTQELLPQLATGLDINPKVNEAHELMRKDSAQLSIQELLFMPMTQMVQK